MPATGATGSGKPYPVCFGQLADEGGSHFAGIAWRLQSGFFDRRRRVSHLRQFRQRAVAHISAFDCFPDQPGSHPGEPKHRSDHMHIGPAPGRLAQARLRTSRFSAIHGFRLRRSIATVFARQRRMFASRRLGRLCRPATTRGCGRLARSSLYVCGGQQCSAAQKQAARGNAGSAGAHREEKNKQTIKPSRKGATGPTEDVRDGANNEDEPSQKGFAARVLQGEFNSRSAGNWQGRESRARCRPVASVLRGDGVSRVADRINTVAQGERSN